MTIIHNTASEDLKAFTPDYTDQEYFNSLPAISKQEGKNYMNAVLDRMAGTLDLGEFVPAAVGDAIVFTYQYAGEHHDFRLTADHFRPVFTKDASFYSEYPSYTRVKQSFENYGKETDRSVTELLSYLNALLLETIDAACMKEDDDSEKRLDTIQLMSLKLFCVGIGND